MRDFGYPRIVTGSVVAIPLSLVPLTNEVLVTYPIGAGKGLAHLSGKFSRT